MLSALGFLRLMNSVSKLLWIDCVAGSSVGLLLILFHVWLSVLYALPVEFVLFQGIANLVYSFFSYALASRRRRPYVYIASLAIANMIWGALCVVWLFMYSESASIFGSAHLFLEAVFVGGLGVIEWRYRRVLVNAESVDLSVENDT